MRQPDSEKFALLRRCERIWAIASVHGEADRLIALHDQLSRRIRATDRVVYLGNYMGVGPQVRAVIDELIEFRRWLLARPRAFANEVEFLRGAQEEMWSKLLQLQFAPNPGEVLRWLLDHGTAATLAAYGGDPRHAAQVAREGPVAMTRWTGGLRAALAACPGHQPFLSGLRRAAFTDDQGDQGLLFVHTGIDVSRPLGAQSDSFWWAGGAFARIGQPYEGFKLIVRGYDAQHAGLVATPFTLSLDGGCGFGGPLLAACLDRAGQVIETVDA
jgi:serine/threonine protein phosphatase 1